MQLGTKLGANKFSYCLPSLNDQSTASSPMIFGEDAGFSGAQPIPLPPNPASPSYWYLPIKGFTVAGAPVHLPNGTFAINPNGSGGMIIDTGANILLLFKVAYDAIVSAIKNATNVPPVDAMAETGSDLCYNGDDGDLKVAPLGFVFEGGAELVLPLENYMVKAGVGLKYLCFAAAVTPETFSVMGNIAQQNIHFLFDHDSFTFAFRHAHCDQL
ncbi:protein ASPARTIC PROTEASE IN GUARD CELL 2 [Cryptomeria japonica]|uniref:protein ASPARTIC PROTEASE IN GUARD CELL 2 n=1 Tax=Cryptomeria japonica TaxID=3369 RepID=UPI0025ABFB53|nr:protein ASPARTIC PROTEASE IN GUARD CELL 2 [Cryptomeria japonica]